MKIKDARIREIIMKNFKMIKSFYSQWVRHMKRENEAKNLESLVSFPDRPLVSLSPIPNLTSNVAAYKNLHIAVSYKIHMTWIGLLPLIIILYI